MINIVITVFMLLLIALTLLFVKLVKVIKENDEYKRKHDHAKAQQRKYYRTRQNKLKEIQ